MKPQFVLRGLRFRGGESGLIEAALVERAGADLWRAVLRPAAQARVGDRLHFGETSESAACLLGRLDAEIVTLSGDEVLLAFDFTGPALEEALERLGSPSGQEK